MDARTQTAKTANVASLAEAAHGIRHFVPRVPVAEAQPVGNVSQSFLAGVGMAKHHLANPLKIGEGMDILRNVHQAVQLQAGRGLAPAVQADLEVAMFSAATDLVSMIDVSLRRLQAMADEAVKRQQEEQARRAQEAAQQLQAAQEETKALFEKTREVLGADKPKAEPAPTAEVTELAASAAAAASGAAQATVPAPRSSATSSASFAPSQKPS